MKWNLDNKWILRLLALVLSIVLFTFVLYENQSRIRSTSPTDGASITSSEVITNLPIDINIDRDEYFVSGIPETATIRLEGPQAVLTQTLATQNFDIITPNLNDLGPGTHTVELEAEGLSSQLDYSIMPTEVTLDIENKIVEEHELQIEFNESAHLESGYISETPVLSDEVVIISGAESTMETISDVMVVAMPEGSDITDDIELSLNVLVLDSTGDPLDVNISPQEVEVVIPVHGVQRTLPIVLEEVGDAHADYEYTLEMAQGESEEITVTGDSEAIEELSNFTVDVDISGITESTIRTVPLDLPEGISETEPEEIEVLIRVEEIEEDEEESTAESEPLTTDDDETNE